MTQGELTAIILAEKKAIIHKIVHESNVVTAMVLRDTLHFGQKRIIRILEKILDLHDSIERGYVAIDEIEKCLKEEVDLTIR